MRQNQSYSKKVKWFQATGLCVLIVTFLLPGTRTAEAASANPKGLHRAPVTYGNLSVGKFYTFSQEPASAYPDLWPCPGYSDGAKLTDEAVGMAWPLNDWVGWHNKPTVEITLDLGKVYAIDTVRLHTCSRTEWSIAFPQNLDIWIRTDQSESWQSYGQAQPPSDTSGFSQAWLTIEGDKTDARYVKYTLTGHSQYVFVSEIEVYGDIVQTWKNVPEWGCYHGAFPVDTFGNMTIPAFEAHAQKTLSMVLWYHHMGNSSFGSLANLSPILQLPTGGHRYLSIGWLPDLTAEEIAQGQLDAYLEQWFTDSQDFSQRNGRSEPIFIRPMNEMNSGWISYGHDPLNFRRAWRRMYNIAEQIGVTDFDIFVWAPNHRSYPDEPWNNMDNYYPGDHYVDWVGISAYPPSAGIVPEDERYPRGRLREFYELYADRKPLMIAEGGFSEHVDRVRWVHEWFDVLRDEYPMIKAAIWENHNDRRIEATEETRQAYRERVADPYFLDNIYAGRVDYNQDGQVNLADAAVLAEHWMYSTAAFYSYFDSCGLIVIEAEGFMQKTDGSGGAAGHAWQVLTDNPNAIGGAYVQALPNVGLSISDNIEQQSPRLSYTVYVGCAGTYHLWVRSVGDSAASDTAWYGLNGQVVGSFDGTIRTNLVFNWKSNVGVLEFPTPGLYTVDIWMADDGLKLDRFLLTSNPGYSAAGEPAVSQLANGPIHPTDIDGDGLTDMSDFFRLIELWLQ